MEKLGRKELESLSTLRFINNISQRYLESLDDIPESNHPSGHPLYMAVKSQIVIYACGYRDEWNVLRGMKNKSVLPFLEQAQPAIQRFDKWKGMREFRNTMLAHNFRIKNGKERVSVFTEAKRMMQLVIPDHITELALLLWCTDAATKIVTNPFANQIEMYEKEHHREIPETVKIRTVDFENETIELIKKMGLI